MITTALKIETRVKNNIEAVSPNKVFNFEIICVHIIQSFISFTICVLETWTLKVTDTTFYGSLSFYCCLSPGWLLSFCDLFKTFSFLSLISLSFFPFSDSLTFAFLSSSPDDFFSSLWGTVFSLLDFAGVVLVCFKGVEDFLLGGARREVPLTLFGLLEVNWVLLKQLATMNGVALHLYSTLESRSPQGNSFVRTWLKYKSLRVSNFNPSLPLKEMLFRNTFSLRKRRSSAKTTWGFHLCKGHRWS